MTNTTPARPAAVDTEADMYELTEYDVDVFERASLVTGRLSAEAGAALIADWRRLRKAEAAAYAMMMDIERERNALRAALPDPMMLHRVLTALERIESDPEIDALWDDLRNVTYAVSTATPAREVRS